ncbi:MAG: hypothetical protein KME49_11750 [Brasilonema octagenarum HA4186-MV1]|nr:hypothetical protein [Brasilonema octagenarum HA4186-MV1]
MRRADPCGASPVALVSPQHSGYSSRKCAYPQDIVWEGSFSRSTTLDNALLTAM